MGKRVPTQTPSPQPCPARGEGVRESAPGAAEALPGREGSEQIHQEWRILNTPAGVAAAAVECLLTAAQAAIAARGHFRVVLAGGRTPELAYRLLAEEKADWARWELYLGDERCLPEDHAERNSRLIERAWLSRIPPDLARVHFIPAERGPVAGAAGYAPRVVAVVPFDLVLLGVGEDGHTASLFPGQPLDPEAWVVPVWDAPKPPPERVSMGLRALRSTRRLLVLATGMDKRVALGRWRAAEDLPIARVCQGMPVSVLVDVDADPTS